MALSIIAPKYRYSFIYVHHFGSQCHVTRGDIVAIILKTYKTLDLSAYLARHNLSDITDFKPPQELEKQIASMTLANGFSAMNGNKTPEMSE